MPLPEHLAAIDHDGCHAAVALLLRLRVLEVTVDKGRAEGRAHTVAVFSDEMAARLSTAEMCEYRAVIALSAVLFRPGRGSQSDGDVDRAFEFAEMAGVAEGERGKWVDARSDEAARIIGTQAFRDVHQYVTGLLLETPTVAPLEPPAWMP